jgi:hypothetical protein
MTCTLPPLTSFIPPLSYQGKQIMVIVASWLQLLLSTFIIQLPEITVFGEVPKKVEGNSGKIILDYLDNTC